MQAGACIHLLVLVDRRLLGERLCRRLRHMIIREAVVEAGDLNLGTWSLLNRARLLTLQNPF